MQALHVAAMRGHTAAVELLLAAGMPAKIRSSRGWTALDEACAARAMTAARWDSRGRWLVIICHPSNHVVRVVIALSVAAISLYWCSCVSACVLRCMVVGCCHVLLTTCMVVVPHSASLHLCAADCRALQQRMLADAKLDMKQKRAQLLDSMRNMPDYSLQVWQGHPAGSCRSS